MAKKAKKPATKPKTVRQQAAEPVKKTSKARRPGRQRRLKSAASAAKRPLRVFRIFGFLVPRYFKNSWGELRQVTWPSRRETFQMTIAVFIFAIFFAAVVTVMDYGLDKLFKKILLQ